MGDIKINLTNMSNRQIAEELRRQATRYSGNPLATWRWWSGFMWGAVLIAAMDYGDVHLCIGSCDAVATSFVKDPPQ